MAPRKATVRKATPAPAANVAQHVAPPAAVVAIINLHVLAAINLATLNGSFSFVEPADYLPMSALGLVLVNEGYANPDAPTQRAAQITDAGRTYLADHAAASVGAGPSFGNSEAAHAPPAAHTNGQTAPPATAKAPAKSIADKFKFAVVNVAPGDLPSPKRGGGGGRTREAQPTPLDNLEVGQAYDFPVTAEMPNPSKELAPVVSSANRKYARDTGLVETKNETVLLVDERGAPVIDPATGKQATQIEQRDIPVKEYDRRFEARTLHNADGTLWGCRIQRMK